MNYLKFKVITRLLLIFWFSLSNQVNSFENKSIQHSITYKRLVDIDNDDVPEIFNFGEHYHVRSHNPHYKLQRKWKESKI